ncbi:MAG: 4Fe-4S binding protein [Gammaproteobacteria bacterium]|nr:4Fe-4S binding protein [Gammaproteobacteria bacterium]
MKVLLRLVAGLLVCLLAFAPVLAAAQTAYEAPLPPELTVAADLCAHAPCREVLPGADSFSVRKGRPPYVEAYRSQGGEKKLVGYIFLSSDVVDIPAYSGKPIITLVGMDTQGRFTGSKILKHSEPILLLGIPETSLIRYIKQYVGKSITDKLELGRARSGSDAVSLDAISGATVTLITQNQLMTKAGASVARQVGILATAPRQAGQLAVLPDTLDWRTLVKEGAVQRLLIKPEEVGLQAAPEPYIDLWFGYLNAPAIGRSILGTDAYESLMSRLAPGEHALFIIGSGRESFKGSGFVRGGLFDRVQVTQEVDTYTFYDRDYQNLYSLVAPGAPAFRESAILIIREPGFSAAYPWNLAFLGNRMDPETGLHSFATFGHEYWLPDRHLAEGRAELPWVEPGWFKPWQTRAYEIISFVLLLAFTALIYAKRDSIVRQCTRRDKRVLKALKYLVWTVSVLLVGFHAMAQPSVTHILTWFHSLVYQWRWELFLSDPFIFIFWWFIIITVFIWGRGLFCGWLCPYGSLTEMLHKTAGALGLKRFQFEFSKPVHDRLRWIKYFIFAALLGVSFYSMGLAERLAEVEPFKTTFLLGVWNRSWPFVVFWVALIVWSMFTERPFCKYLCPLGAGLALPTTFRFFGLRRKAECTTCHACQAGCGPQAINDRGEINVRECLLCLDCQVLYYDPEACPPLAGERKRRVSAGLPLTPINGRGYYIPIQVEAGKQVEDHVAAARSAGDRLRLPDGQEHLGLGQWLWQECRLHLLPWGAHFLREPFAIRAVGLGLAVVVTLSWILAATQQVGPAVTLAWWIGWSVYEVLTRMRNKPWVKEGPWWERNYRRADLADMIAYVVTKNLLIAIVLFVVLQTVGVLDILQDLPPLKWLHE